MFKSFFMSIALLGVLFVFEAEAVVIDGVDWAQPADFKNMYSYDDLLNSFDVSTGELKIDDSDPLYTVFKGYTWASDQEVVTMLSGLTNQSITTQTEKEYKTDGVWDYNGEIDAIMDVFNSHDGSLQYYWLGGWARKIGNINTGFFTEIEIDSTVEERYAFWKSGQWHSNSDYKNNDTGVWMYRSEIPPVPEPTTAILLGIGLLGLARISRRKK